MVDRTEGLQYSEGQGYSTLDAEAARKRLDGYAVISGLEVTSDGTDLTLDVSAGSATVGETSGSVDTVSLGSAGTVTVDAGDPSNPRKDTIYIDTTGTLQVEKGTPESALPSGNARFDTFQPEPPQPSVEGTILAEVWVAVGASTISSGDVRDRRVPSKWVGDEVVAGSVGADVAQLNDTTTSPTTAGEGRLNGADVEFYSGGSVRSLSNIGSGSGVDVEDDGTVVVSGSTAINFGSNVSVTDDGDGTVTVSASGGGGGTTTLTRSGYGPQAPELDLYNIPLTTLADTDFTENRRYFSDSFLYLNEIGVQNNSGNAPAGLQARLVNTSGTALYTSNQKSESGKPLVGLPGGQDVSMQLFNNGTGSSQDASSYYRISTLTPTLTRDGDNPVFTNADLSWGATNGPDNPRILRHPETCEPVKYDGRYWMAYAAGTEGIGVAYSYDLETWTDSADSPVLLETDANSEAWESAYVLSNAFLWMGDYDQTNPFWLFYAGEDSGGTVSVGVAYTSDMATFTRDTANNPVFTHAAASGVEDFSVVRGSDDTWRAVFEENGTTTGVAVRAATTGATLPNSGWTDQGAILADASGYNFVANPAVLRLEGEESTIYNMYYEGIDSNGDGHILGAWQTEASFTSNWNDLDTLLSPSSSWETVDGGAVIPNGVVRVNGRNKLYYKGNKGTNSNVAVGVADGNSWAPVR